MCYKQYTISIFGLNLLIFGTCLLTVSIECIIDINTKKLDNSDNLKITCIVLSITSSLMLILSLFSIRKMEHNYFLQNDVL